MKSVLNHLIAWIVLVVIAMILALGFPHPANAQSTSGSQSTAGAVSSPQNIGNPTINMAPANPLSLGAVDYRTNQAAPGGTVFVNPPAADTCARPGFGLSGGVVSGNLGLSVPMGASDTCEVRADAINLKVTGAPPEVIKARQCQNPSIAKAYADAGFPCPGERATTFGSLESEGQRTAWWGTSSGVASAEPTDPFIRARLGLN